MSSIIIKGMELPKDGSMIFAIRPDGMVEDVMGCYVGKAVPVPPHGRLIDADAAVANQNAEMNWVYDLCDLPSYLADCPTVIPASDRDINVLGKEEGE